MIGLTVLSLFPNPIIGQVDYSPDPAPQPLQCPNITQQNQNDYIPYVSAPECIYLKADGPSDVDIEIAPQQFVAEAGNRIHIRRNVHFGPNTHIRIDVDPDFELAWYAPGVVGQAHHYEKLEIGLRPSDALLDEIANFFDNNPANGDGLNPYNRHDIDFEMTFFHEGTPVDKVDAFYYTPQIIVSDEMVDDITSYPFRFRHSPRFLGSYHADVNIIVSGVLLKTKRIEFHVLPSDNKGYLEVGKFEHHFRYAKTKKSFLGVGQCIPWPNIPTGGDFHQKTPFSQLKAEIGDIYEEFDAAGGNISRLVSAEWALQMEVEHLGNYESRRDHGWYLDKLADYCVDAEIYFIYCMRLHHEFRADSNSIIVDSVFNKTGWPYSPYYIHNEDLTVAAEPNIGISDVREFFSNPMARDHYKNYIRYVVSRWGYASSIAGWQLMSEITDCGGYRESITQSDIMHDWIDDMAKFMHLEQFDRHPRSVASTGRGNPKSVSALDHIELYGSEYIDFTGLHTYSYNNPNTLANHQFANTTAYHQSQLNGGIFRNRSLLPIWEAVRNITTGSNGETTIPPTYLQRKPFVFDEYGGTSTDFANDGQLNNTIQFSLCSPDLFHNDLWSSICSGSAFTGLDWWVSNEPLKHDLWYENFYGITAFFSDVDFESVNYCDYRHDNKNGLYYAQRWPWDSKDIVETNHSNESPKDYKNSTALEAFSMVSSNGHQGFGWLHNRSHYWFNLRNESTCIDDMIKGNLPWADTVLIRPNDDDITNGRDVQLDDDFIRVRHVKLLRTYIVTLYDPITNQVLDEYEKLSSIYKKLKIAPTVISDEYQDVAYKFRWKRRDWKSADHTPPANNQMESLVPRESFLKDDILIYPNPNSGSFTVDANGTNIKSVSIVDGVGSNVFQQNDVNLTSVQLELELANGNYMIVIELEGETVVKKIMIE